MDLFSELLLRIERSIGIYQSRFSELIPITSSSQHLVGVRWLRFEFPLWQIGVMLNCAESLQTSRWVDPVVATVIVARRVSKRRSSDALEIKSRLNETSLGRDQTVSATSSSVRCIQRWIQGVSKLNQTLLACFMNRKKKKKLLHKYWSGCFI